MGMTMTENRTLLREFNRALAENDTGYLDGCVTDDVRWTIAGKYSIKGRKAFSNVIREMSRDQRRDVKVAHIITDGNGGAVHGTMSATGPSGARQTLSFCDIYRLSGSHDAKIEEIISYTIPINSAEPA